ncbi:Fanconi anemia core complex-associated protein 24 [Trichoplax sp. H2]|nr:Fanconi anemia core complex-associated protein 24 [Trichoplax sp. H2]|eukprot:RDD43057.1 Fanconi anemia core complex-associated protein 24 [Trichoplax sp. H2]
MANSVKIKGMTSTPKQKKKKTSPTISPASRNIRVPTGHLIISDKYNDSRSIIQLLKEQIKVVIESNLGLIDFYPSPGCGVIHFKENDIIDTTGWKEKLRKLMQSPLKVIILAEKTLTNNQYYDQLQTSAVIEFGMVLLPIHSTNDIASYLSSLVNQATRPVYHNKFLVKRKPEPINQAVVSTLKLLPSVGETKARLLLNRFHSIAGISHASVEELAEVIGSSSAVAVKKAF